MTCYELVNGSPTKKKAAINFLLPFQQVFKHSCYTFHFCSLIRARSPGKPATTSITTKWPPISLASIASFHSSLQTVFHSFPSTCSPIWIVLGFTNHDSSERDTPDGTQHWFVNSSRECALRTAHNKTSWPPIQAPPQHKQPLLLPSKGPATW